MTTTDVDRAARTGDELPTTAERIAQGRAEARAASPAQRTIDLSREGPGKAELNQTHKLTERARKKIAGEIKGPVYGGPTRGPLTVVNSAVLFFEKISSTLRTADGGLMRLEPDEFVNGRWITLPDAHTPRRVELVIDLTHEHLSVSNQLASAEVVSVYRINGDVDKLPRSEVTATDWLRLYVREHALSAGSDDYAREALNALRRKENEAWTAVAARVVLNYRATLANADRPYITEAPLFWRFVSTLELKALYEKLLAVLIPQVVDRIGLQSLMHDKTHEVDTTLQPLRVEWHDPRGHHMTQRGVVAEELFRKFTSVLSVRASQYRPVAAPKSKIAGPDRLFSLDDLRRMCASPETLSALQTLSRPGVLSAGGGAQPPPLANTTPALARAPAASFPLAAFQNQQGSNPGIHGAPPAAAAASEAPPSTQEKAKPDAIANAPPVAATRRIILDYLRTHRVCFMHALSGKCRRPDSCPYTHDTFFAARYKDAARAPGGAAPRRQLFALTETQYATAVEMGICGSDEDISNNAEETES